VEKKALQAGLQQAHSARQTAVGNVCLQAPSSHLRDN